jgi:ribosomal protein S27E
MRLHSLSATNVSCFCAGTRISTPNGSVNVETLVPGDTIASADGGTSKVKWLGRQPIDTQLMHPATVNPIRFTAGALGCGLPERDLTVSPDHAVAIDGYLINAGALVNGRTIYQVETMPKDGFTYYHVETETHNLLLAEGVAAETYIDYASIDAFENAKDRADTSIAEMAMPRVSTRRMVPEHIIRSLAPVIAAE